MSYNGWTNYETWLCNIWYDSCFEIIAEESAPGTSCGDLAERFEHEIREDLAEMTNRSGVGFFKDLMSSAIGEINFEELADAFMEFVPAEEDEEAEDDEDRAND